MFLYALILMIFRPKPVLKKKTEIYGSKTPVSISSDEDADQEKSRIGIFKRTSSMSPKAASKKGFLEFFDLKLERAGLKMGFEL
jgi:hypothetical protein